MTDRQIGGIASSGASRRVLPCVLRVSLMSVYRDIESVSPAYVRRAQPPRAHGTEEPPGLAPGPGRSARARADREPRPAALTRSLRCSLAVEAAREETHRPARCRNPHRAAFLIVLSSYTNNRTPYIYNHMHGLAQRDPVVVMHQRASSESPSVAPDHAW